MKQNRFHDFIALLLVLATLLAPWMSGARAQTTSKFDFGTTTSEADYVAVDNTINYTTTRGYGWVATTGLSTRDRSGPDDLRRDFILGTSGQTFRVSGLTPGRYTMKVICGDLSYGDHVITVSVPNAGTLPTLSPRTGQFLMLSATVETTGVLDIAFGSPSNNWVVNSLTLEPATSTITPSIQSANVSEWSAAVFATDPTQALLKAYSGGGGSFQSTGLSRSDYLTLIASEVDFWKTKQNSSGAIIDPYKNTEWQYSTPAFANAAAVLVAYGNRADLVEPAAKALDWASLRLSQRAAANSHEDFYPPMIAHAYMLLKPYVTANRATTWANRISSIDPYSIYRYSAGTFNWNVVSSSGEFMFQKLGLRTTNLLYVDESIGAQGRHFTSPLGLYTEGPLAYDHFPRIFYADVLAQGYNGLYKNELETALGRAAVASLFMQSPWGEMPSGGRSAHHQWNEAEQCMTYEIYAAKAQREGNTQMAGAYKRAAHLALASMKRWVRPSGEMQIVKNWVDPAQSHGYEGYSAHSQYNVLPMAMLANAYEYAASTETVAERAAPADTGGFMFQIPELHKVIANAGGTYIELDTSADHHYDATGLNRVHRKGISPQLGPSDSLMSAAAYNSPNPVPMTTGVGVAWKGTDSAWHTLGEMGETEITSVTVTPLAQSSSRVAFDVTYQGSMAGVSRLVEHYVVTPDGVQLTTELSGYNGALRYIWPVLSNDGKTKSTISTSGQTVSVSQGSGTAQTFTAPGAQSVRVEATEYSNHNGWARLGIAEYPSGGKITLLIGQTAPTPQNTFNVLFSDSFDRTDNGKVGVNDNKLGGTLTATYAERETASVAGNQLLLGGDTASVTPGLNFNQSPITSGGFVDIEFDCNPLSNSATNGTGWVGLTLGQSAAPTEAAYNTTGKGKDFSLLLRDNGQFQALSTGATIVAPDTIFDSVPAATEPETYHVRVRVATKSFAQGEPFTISATLSGELDAVAGDDTATLDLNGTATGTDFSGTWTGTGNFITLESNTTSTLDNLTINALSDATVAPNVTTLFWKGDVDGNWNTNTSNNTNWTSDLAGNKDPGQLPDASTDVVFAADGANNLPATVLGSDVSTKGVTVNNVAGLTVGGTRNLILGESGLTIASGTEATTINTTGQVILGASQEWRNNSSNALNVASVISGSGALTLSGNATFTGNNTSTGTTTISAGTLRLGNGGTSGTLAGSIVNNGVLVINRLNTATLSGAISGTGNLTKSGAGKLTLSGNNTYTGDTTVSAGTLALGASERIADKSKLVLSGGTFSTGGNSETLGELALLSDATINVGGAGTLTLSGAGTFTDGKTLTIAGDTAASRLFIGQSAVLTAAQLAQINFDGLAAKQLATGEVVPVAPPAANTAPTISQINGQTLSVNTASNALTFTIGDAQTAAASLTVSASSSNATLVPNTSANLTLAGSDANRTLVVTPATDQIGQTTITLIVSDGTLSTSTNFLLTVSPEAAAGVPVVTGASTLEDKQTTSGLVLSGATTDGTDITHFGISGISNGTLFQNDGTTAIDNNTFISVAQGQAGLKFTPSANFNGAASFQVRGASDATGSRLGSPATATISVAAVNDAPLFTKGANQTVEEDAGAQSVSNWATNISAGAANESGQTLAFTLSTTNRALFAVQPALSASGTLTYTPAANASGSTTISVVLKDNGDTSNGGVDQSDTQTFTITVNAVNDAPTISGLANVMTSEDMSTSPLIVLVGDNDTPVSSLRMSATSSNTTLVPNSNITWSGSGANRLITLTPAANCNGQTTITLTVSDATSSATTRFVLTVMAVNDAPSFVKGADVTVAPGSIARTFANWAKSLSAGPSDEARQSVRFQVWSDDELSRTLFAVFPTISSIGTLSFTPASGATGNVTMKVRLLDSDGAGSDVQSFTLSVMSPGTAPIVRSFSPARGDVGTLVKIEGTSFAPGARVAFGGIASINVQFVSATQLQAVVPSGATTGAITVTTNGASAQSSTPFSLPPRPAGFSPSAGKAGTRITLNGFNFLGTSNVKIGGVSASFTVVSNNRMLITVPAGARSGKIQITTPGGTVSTFYAFTVTSQASADATTSSAPRS